MTTDIIHLDGRTWRNRADMAEHLGVSERTVTRKVKRGELTRKDNPDGPGKLYCLPRDTRQDTTDETGQRDTPTNVNQQAGKIDETPARQDTTRDRTGQPSVSQILNRLESQAERIGRLESENQRLREKVNRLEADDTEGAAEDDGPSEAKRLVDALRETADTNA